jgi:glutaminyl-tRNA synthetase
VVKDNAGNVIEILCTYDPQTKSGEDSSGRKVKGTIHWVNRSTAEEMTVRLYDRLFTEENPGKLDGDRTFLDVLNPNSLKTITGYGEPALANLAVGDRVQFERLGYFIKDTDSTQDQAVFNRIVTLKDTWGKMEAKGQTD